MNRDYYRQHAYGSTQFATEEDVQALTKGTGPIARHGNTILRFRPEEPTIVFGGAGSGKGANLGFYQMVHERVGSLFVTDITGEHISTTWHYNLKLNRDAYAINVEGTGAYPEINHPVHLWGILKDDIYLYDNARRIAAMALTDNDGKGDNAWVGQGARRWLVRVMILLVFINGRVTPSDLFELINAMDADDEVLKTWARSSEHLPYNIYGTLIEILRKKHGSEKEYGAIMGTIKDQLDWLSSPTVAATVSGDEDYLAYLGDPTKKVAIYYILRGGSSKQMESLTRMVVGISQLHCIRADKGAKPLFYLEEANACGGADFVKDAASLYRRFFSTVFVYQSYGQLIHLFGKSGAQEMMDSCGTQIYLGGGIRDPESARRLADAIGKTTIYIDDPMAQADRWHKADQAVRQMLFEGLDPQEARRLYQHEFSQSQQQRQTGRYAIDPAELMRLKNEVLILVPTLGMNPILAQKLLPYWENYAVAGRYAPNPYFPPNDRVKIQRKRFGSTTRRFMRKPVPNGLAERPNHISGEIFYIDGFKTW